MMRVVLDTNVVVSALLSPGGAPAQILRLERDGNIRLIFSPDTLKEHWRVLSSAKIRKYMETRGVSFQTVEEFLKNIARISIAVPGSTKVDVLREDPSDNVFLACALEGGADFIVSGDEHLKALGSFEGIPVLGPTSFLAIVSGEKKIDENP
ncbi:MAG: putative toxin-antitoxin system toxin component, PIN family [Syntrophobacteraceae bacterium]|jgi:putative PIN family toxin of toxin-antitoxin system